MSVVACVDVGSTYTKALAVELPSGRLLAGAEHPTTLGSDVLHGLDAAVAALGVPVDGVRACSSAGGGLRLAVVGYERGVTAEAGYRVGLSAGARVVHVAAGPLDGPGVRALRGARPDVLLLCGGTDGGNADVLVHNAGRLARARLRRPVVLAGNADARDEVAAALAAARIPVTATANVLPRIGALDPAGARAAIREVFLRHVIGGKHLSRGPRFASLVRAATPDAVLAGVERLADGAGGIPGAGDVAVVDVGGATTDVYSVLSPPDAGDRVAGALAEAAGTLWRARTVEGDLGVRWGAPGVVEAAAAERLLAGGEAEALAAAAAVRAADPSYVPDRADGLAVDRRLAQLAALVALRRHARPADLPGGVRSAGRDLRHVRLLVGSGGVLRHADPADAAALLGPALSDHAGGWRVPERARVAVDARYVLAAAGLLSADEPRAAAALLAAHLPG